MFQKFFITTGDSDGVGLEVASKALNEITPGKNLYYLVRTKNIKTQYLSLLDKNYKRKTFTSLSDALNFNSNEDNLLIDLELDQTPHEAFQTVAEHINNDASFSGVITGPMSKAKIQNITQGHTNILEKIHSDRHLKMAFMGEKFNVVLHTHHIPLGEVSKNITQESLKTTLSLTLKNRHLFSCPQLPIGVLALNPHAGENEKLGTEESGALRDALSFYNREDFVGPLVPDVAFQKPYWDNYSTYVSLYHDQGLIPFKMIHGHHRGIQVTLGLPYVRTSVDHGTAKELFHRDCANPNSMIKALKWASRAKINR